MDRFLQLHILTAYPPSNLNRDDLGRPKTAVMGGALRLRISSQSLKRAWRKSELFETALGNHVGTRTKEMGVKVYHALREKDVAEKNARDWAIKIADAFGKVKKSGKDKSLQDFEIEQLAHFSPEETAAIDTLIEKLTQPEATLEDDDLKLLKHHHSAADIAMFGRMLASKPEFNTEAAVQVAHAVSVHKAQVEDDFFTAVDDLNEGIEDVGAGHMGEIEFGVEVYYLYICIDRELLQENLNNDAKLAAKTIAALVESAATVAPTGKQNSFASRARASYILAEKGGQQPRSLAVAFLKPVSEREGSGDMLAASVKRLEDKRGKMEKVYGPCANAHENMNAETGQGDLAGLITFCQAE